ncbi:5'-nucleotidase C-terminal domain-containing protein [Flavobacterium branchiophilum]|uniref:5'-Nucleotidase C-terminal domain-containing protein n=1 Tax=Flavobacterium branchiophilum TaxID=55197 RepID=A0A2H3KP10_9FLAO|nr:5'-nucleotidase [Flavobacterium branchiophilum]PDS22767.1 hypothetical protein B0A77_12685 [Flavobacterium branchiophilum]
MVKLKNYIVVFKHFVIFLTIFIFLSCQHQRYYITKIEAKKISLSEKDIQNPDIEQFIKPYREHINKDLSEILAYNPENLDKKDGDWQTAIGCLLADITFEKGNKVFLSRENKPIDMCLLNHGGIRSNLPQGNITSKNAFQLMPFENALYIVALKGEQILEMTQYLIAEKKPHPLSGMTFTIDKNNQAKNIEIQGKPLDTNKIYFVATSDYLSGGGDSMEFFKKSTTKYDMNYKLRNIVIDYLKEVDTIKVTKNKRIIKENAM